MAQNKLTLEYDLADIEGYGHRNLDDLRARGLRFSRYGDDFVAERSLIEPHKALTLAETRAIILQSKKRPQHAIRVYVAAKRLAGDGSSLSRQVRVFSSYKAMNHYIFDHHGDDPSPDDDDIITCMTTCIIDATSEYRPCDCLEHMAQEEALEALEPAVPGPQSSGQVDARAVAVEARDDALVLTLQDGRRLEVPRSWFAFVDSKNSALWQGARLDGTRRFVKWPGTRKRVAIEGLLFGA